MANAFEKLRRSFAQTMIQRRYMPVVEVRLLINKLNHKYDYDLSIDSDDELGNFIATLNTKLSLLHLKLSQFSAETTRERFVVLCNTLSSDLSRNPSFNEQQMALFKEIVRLIVESPNGTIDADSVGDAAKHIKNCSLNTSQIHATIKQLVAQKYLDETDAALTLTPVAFVELQPYITTTMSDKIVDCFGCKSLCLQGERCSNSECSGKIHRGCARTVFLKNQNCRVCNCPWRLRSPDDDEMIDE